MVSLPEFQKPLVVYDTTVYPRRFKARRGAIYSTSGHPQLAGRMMTGEVQSLCIAARTAILVPSWEALTSVETMQSFGSFEPGIHYEMYRGTVRFEPQ